MKLNKLTVGIIGLAFLTGNISYAQKSNVVSAALAYKNYMPNLMQKKFDKAKEALMEAKEYIDPAMQHEDTKNEEKANYYNAMINYSLMEFAGIGKYPELNVYTNDSILDVIKTSTEKTETSNRWNGELKDFFKRKVSQAVSVGQMMYKQKKYKMAFAGFIGAYKVKEIAGLDKNLQEMKENAIISGRHYLDTLRKTDKNQEALDFAANLLELEPSNAAIAIEGVNIALDMDDLKTAESFFDKAAEASPDNKMLFSNMGSIFLAEADKQYQVMANMNPSDSAYQKQETLVDEMYDKAAKNLKRALKIDPDYADAAYNLGVLYLGRGEKLKTNAANLELNDPRYKGLIDKSMELYKKAIPPLETYIKTDPNNAAVLRVIYQVYRGVGNNEKALEYRKRYVAAKAAAEGE